MLQPKLFLYNSYHYVITSLYVTLLIVLISCENNSLDDLTRYIEQIKTEQKGKIKPLPEMKQIESYLFDPKGLRNPFIPFVPFKPLKPILAQDGKNNIKPDMTRQKEILESFPLDILKMVGTIKFKSNLWALIKVEDKLIYKVHIGNYLGKNYGKITQISINKIELTEVMVDHSGQWHEHQTSLALIE